MKNPAFLLYVQDFLNGTYYLTNEQVGAYIKLLCRQWDEGAIPKKRLGFILGSDWESIFEAIAEKFETDENGNIYNLRLEAEREKRDKFREKQASNGMRGGRPPKKTSENKTQKKPKLNPEETQTKPNTKPKKKQYEDEDENENENINNKLLCEIQNSEIDQNNINYLEAAKAFQQLFKQNLIEAGASTKQVEAAKGTWINDIRLTIESDGYTMDDLRQVFKFLEKDDFWKNNILSTKKLRQQMDKLKLKIHSNGKNQRNNKEATSWNELAAIIQENF